MIGIFKNNNPLALLMLALLAYLPAINAEATVNAAVPPGSTAILKALSEYLSFLDGSKGMLGKTIYTSLLLTEALLLNKIISDHKLMERAGFIPAMSFLLLNTLLPLHTSPVFLVLNGIILLVLKWMIVMYKQNNASNLSNVIGRTREMSNPDDNSVHGQIIGKIAVGSNCAPAPRGNVRKFGVTVVEDPLDATGH